MYVCKDCDIARVVEEMNRCIECGHMFCNDCIAKDSNIDNIYCKDCYEDVVRECDNCNATFENVRVYAYDPAEDSYLVKLVNALFPPPSKEVIQKAIGTAKAKENKVKESNKMRANYKLFRDDKGKTLATIYNSIIATKEGSIITLDSCGFNTVTTRKYMNKALKDMGCNWATVRTRKGSIGLWWDNGVVSFDNCKVEIFTHSKGVRTI